MDKQWYKDRIYGYELKIIKLFSDQMHTVPKRTVLKEARQIWKSYTVLLQLSDVEKHSLWNWTVNSYKKVIRKGDLPEALSDLYRAMEKEKNLVADSVEFRKKHDMLYGQNSIIEKARQSNNYSPFFLCSQHKNPAIGHKDYEGLIYYDENWEKYINVGNPFYNDIKEVIKNMYTVQYIIGEPIYLCSRKNCTHFFTNVSIESVIKNNYTKIIDNNDLLGYNKSQYLKYYQKVKLLKTISGNEKLKIKEANFLMKKWKIKD